MTRENPVHHIVATDDDPYLLYQMVTALKDAGHCVFAAFDADSACKLVLAVSDIDLLVTNTRLGTVSAKELIRAVRTSKPHLPILHVGEPLPNTDGLLDDVPNLPEPFTSEQLLAVVEELMGRQSNPV